MLPELRGYSSAVSYTHLDVYKRQALNSGVNDRRGRDFFRSMVSMMGILSGAAPLMLDVRQNLSLIHI